jgi:lambda repressor-like predicted transcriptional regulator
MWWKARARKTRTKMEDNVKENVRKIASDDANMNTEPWVIWSGKYYAQQNKKKS